MNGNIFSELSLIRDLDEKMTSGGREENERKTRTDSINKAIIIIQFRH